MIGFEAAIETLTTEQCSKLENWAISRTKDYVVLPNIFIGILKETADPQKFIDTMRRNFRNWGIQHIKYKREWIKPITVAKYLAYGCSDRLLAQVRDVIKHIVKNSLTNVVEIENTRARSKAVAFEKNMLKQTTIAFDIEKTT